MKDLDLIPEGYKIMIVGSVQEEDCDGMCWQYIYNKDKIVPEFVIIPTFNVPSPDVDELLSLPQPTNPVTISAESANAKNFFFIKNFLLKQLYFL